mgnify:CR=1 FL=1
MYLRDEGISGEVLKQEEKCAVCIIITIKNTWNTAPVIYRTCFACSANADSVFFWTRKGGTEGTKVYGKSYLAVLAFLFDMGSSVLLSKNVDFAYE